MHNMVHFISLASISISILVSNFNWIETVKKRPNQPIIVHWFYQQFLFQRIFCLACAQITDSTLDMAVMMWMKFESNNSITHNCQCQCLLTFDFIPFYTSFHCFHCGCAKLLSEEYIQNLKWLSSLGYYVQCSLFIVRYYLLFRPWTSIDFLCFANANRQSKTIKELNKIFGFYWYIYVLCPSYIQPQIWKVLWPFDLTRTFLMFQNSQNKNIYNVSRIQDSTHWFMQLNYPSPNF